MFAFALQVTLQGQSGEKSMQYKINYLKIGDSARLQTFSEGNDIVFYTICDECFKENHLT